MTLQGEIKRIFTGWMFAASPGLHAVEHPIYDVWLTDCKGGKNPAVAEAPPEPQPSRRAKQPARAAPPPPRARCRRRSRSRAIRCAPTRFAVVDDRQRFVAAAPARSSGSAAKSRFADERVLEQPVIAPLAAPRRRRRSSGDR